MAMLSLKDINRGNIEAWTYLRHVLDVDLRIEQLSGE